MQCFYISQQSNKQVTNAAFFAVVLLFTFFIFVPKSHSNNKYASIVIDANTNKILYSRSADKLRYPASLTKMMTLYVLFRELKLGRITLDTKFIATVNASNQQPSKIGLKPQEKITVINAIRALVTKSANDVATTVAENLAGTELAFSDEMNRTALKLGMKNTKFRNASGLPDKAQKTTARDMLKLSVRLMNDFPQYYGFFKTKTFIYKGRVYKNHNKLLRNYRGTDGIKTGYTRASGFNLVSSVHRGNKHLVAVVMGGRTAKRRDAHMRRLLGSSFRKAVAMKKKPRPKAIKRSVAKAEHKTQPELTKGKALEVVKVDTKSDLVKLKGGIQPLKNDKTISAFSAFGPFHIQVGAFSNMIEAQSKLLSVTTKANDLLKGHPAMAIPFQLKSRNMVRARFAAFSENQAHSVCKRLKKRSIDCIVMQAK